MATGTICSPPPEGLLNHICYEIGVRELIVQGYLCPLKAKAGKRKADFQNLHVRAGEFLPGEVEALMDDDALVCSACYEIIELTKERHSVLIFASGVQHAQHVQRVLQEMGHECGFVCGDTPGIFRDEILKRFKEGASEDGALKYPCEQGDVLILDNELHAETSSDRIPKVGQARNIPMSVYGRRVRVLNLRGRLYDIFSLGNFFQRLQRGQYKVIILDAFYRFMPRDMDENDNGTMASLYNQIDRYADELGCSFVLIHHTTKGNQSAKSVTDVGAGAGSQSRATDTHVILRPHEEEDVMVMDAAVRSWPPISPFCLRREFPIWMPADDLDPHQLRSEPGKKRSEKKETWTPEMFVAAFINDVPATRADIISRAMAAGLSRWSADNLLRAADNQNLMAREGTGSRTAPFQYHLPQTQEARP